MTDDAPVILLVPGLNGSGPDHWQTQWEARREDVRRVEQDCWHDPRPADWIDRLDASIDATDAPIVLVAHSLGCAAVAHWAARSPAVSRVGAALLVAPCDVERVGLPDAIARFAPMPPATLPFRAVVVASTNDPYVSLDRARCFADGWGADFVNAGALGHINAASGLDDWVFGQVLLDELMASAQRLPAHYRRAAALRGAKGWPCGGFTL